MVAYGVPRFSADVDVTVKLEPEDPEPFVRDIEAGGFEFRIRDSEFVQRTRVLPFVHARTLWRLHGSRVDRRRVRRLLRSLEEALGQGDLLPAFDSIATAMHHD